MSDEQKKDAVDLMKDANPMQWIIDEFNRKMQEERSRSQMTLGRMIKKLETLRPGVKIRGLGSLISYRGYYCDLAFKPRPHERTAADLLASCKAAMGMKFEGYKGGLFLMGEDTPLWISDYGTSSGVKLIDILSDGTVLKELEED